MRERPVIRNGMGEIIGEYGPLATYTLQVFGPRETLHKHGMKYAMIGPPEQYLREAEENLTDLLPDGYYVEIKEWDSE